MKSNHLTGIFGLGLILIGLIGCSSATGPGADVELAATGAKPASFKLPDSLYCTRTAVENRITVNLAPLRETLGNPAETIEVFLCRSGREIASLGKIGGGAGLKDFTYVNLMPADHAVFDTSSSARFGLKLKNAAGENLAERAIILMMQ
jgi:hypothetical protein